MSAKDKRVPAKKRPTAKKRPSAKKRPTAKKRPSASNEPAAKTGAAATKGSAAGVVRFRRLAFQCDPKGPRMRYGFGWFMLQAFAFRLGLGGLTVLFAATAGLVAWQLASTWQQNGQEPEPWLSVLFASLIPVAAAADIALVGAVILAGVFITCVAAAMLLRVPARVLAAAGTDIRCWLFAGLAAAGPIVTYRYEPGAALVLLAFVAIYDSGAFMVGAESPNQYEGPVGGLVGVAVVAFLVGVVAVPPFGYGSTMIFAMIAGFGCILGPLAGSLLLPKHDSKASALRRLDSLLLLGPFWAWSVGLLLLSP